MHQEQPFCKSPPYPAAVTAAHKAVHQKGTPIFPHQCHWSCPAFSPLVFRKLQILRWVAYFFQWTEFTGLLYQPYQSSLSLVCQLGKLFSHKESYQQRCTIHSIKVKLGCMAYLQPEKHVKTGRFLYTLLGSTKPGLEEQNVIQILLCCLAPAYGTGHWGERLGTASQ